MLPPSARDSTSGSPHTQAGAAALCPDAYAYLDDLNRDPVVHSWTYQIGEAA